MSAHLEEAFALYEEWGVKGLMVDFLDRDDQEMNDFTERMLACAARHHLHIQIHGSPKPSGEQRTSNFLLWQTAYAELIFLDTLWPDFDRRHLWYACELYAQRDRRFGGALPNPVAPTTAE